MNRFIASALLFLAVLGNTSAFAPATSKFGVLTTRVAPSSPESFEPAALQRQRNSVAQVQTMGLFGLGAPELAVIGIAAAFLLGPEKLASLGKDAGKIAGELKEVPKEFQEGMKEGEAQAQAVKAKMEPSEKTEEKAE